MEQTKPFVAGILVGALSTLILAGIVVFLLIATTQSVEDRYKQVLRDSVQKESLEEQARLNIDCKTMDANLREYLNSGEVDALLGEHENLVNWKQAVTKSALEHTTKTTELVRACSLLYNRGERGKLNGLDHLQYATGEVYVNLSTIDSALSRLATSNCNDSCLRSTRVIVQEALLTLRKQINAAR